MSFDMDEEHANERFIEIAKKYDLNPKILKEIMIARNKGYNNARIAEEFGYNKNTVSRYVNALNKISDEDLKTLLFLIAIIGAGAFLVAFASLLLKPQPPRGGAW